MDIGTEEAVRLNRKEDEQYRSEYTNEYFCAISCLWLTWTELATILVKCRNGELPFDKHAGCIYIYI